MNFPSPNSVAIDRFLREQGALLDAFTKARDAGISTDHGVGLLRRMQARLQDHLATVDRHVYPVLRRLGAQDAQVSRTLAKAEGSEVAAQVQLFFDEQLDPDSPAFFSAWGALYITVQRRFRLERTVLFPALINSPLLTTMTLPKAPISQLNSGPVVLADVVSSRKQRKTP